MSYSRRKREGILHILIASINYYNSFNDSVKKRILSLRKKETKNQSCDGSILSDIMRCIEGDLLLCGPSSSPRWQVWKGAVLWIIHTRSYKHFNNFISSYSRGVVNTFASKKKSPHKLLCWDFNLYSGSLASHYCQYMNIKMTVSFWGSFFCLKCLSF